jgi:hypothetical protein
MAHTSPVGAQSTSVCHARQPSGCIAHVSPRARVQRPAPAPGQRSTHTHVALPLESSQTSASAVQSVTSTARQPLACSVHVSTVSSTHTPVLTSGQKLLQQLAGSNRHVASHARSPVENPSVAHVAPARSAPSHDSPGSATPLPQLSGAQPEVSNVQSTAHASVPPRWTTVSHVAPPRSTPSHISPGLAIPLPQPQSVAHPPAVSPASHAPLPQIAHCSRLSPHPATTSAIAPVTNIDLMCVLLCTIIAPALRFMPRLASLVRPTRLINRSRSGLASAGTTRRSPTARRDRSPDRRR